MKDKVEVIVVNDGSTDETPTVLGMLAKEFPELQIVRHSANRGAAAARNRGVRESTGKILFFCDSDDLFHPEHLLAGVALLGEMVTRDIVSTSLDASAQAVGIVKTGMASADPIHPYWQVAIENTSPLNLCIRRECFEFLEGFPEDEFYRRSGCEDVSFQVMLNVFFRRHHVARPTVEYVRYPGNNLDRQMRKFQSDPRFQDPWQANPKTSEQRRRLEHEWLGRLLRKWLAAPPAIPKSWVNWEGIRAALEAHGLPIDDLGKPARAAT